MNITATRSSVTAKVLKAMSIFSGVQSIGIICSIVRAKFIAIWIGESGVGLFAIYNTVLEMISTSTQLNVRQTAVRDVAETPRSQLSTIAAVVRWWTLRMGIMGVVTAFLLSPLLSYINTGDISMSWAYALLGIAVFALAYTNGEQAIMQGSDRLGALAKSTAIGAVVGTVISVPLYYLFGQGSIIPSILIFAVVGALCTALYNDTPSARNPKDYNFMAGKDFLRLGIYLTISSLVTTVSSYAFLSYINNTTSLDEVGLYQAGYTLVIRYTGIIFTALSMEYFPRITQVSQRSRMTSVVVSHEILLVLYVLTPLLVIFVCADELAVRLLYSEAFLTMLPFVTIGIGAMVFRAISYCMAYVIISRGDGKTYVITEVTSSLVGLGLNIVMYDAWGFMGLGLSYVLWYVIYTLIVWVVYRRYGMRLNAKCYRLIVASTLIVAASIVLKHFGWWAVLPMVPVSLILPFKNIYGRFTTGRDDAEYSIQFRDVSAGTPEHEYVEDLLEASFPESERPDSAAFRVRLEANPLFRCSIIYTCQDTQPVGFITYWHLHDIIYVEHFAIAPRFQGHGYGKATLARLLQDKAKSGDRQLPIVLEVEQPTTDQARRRIAFYERNGLVLWPDTGYLQPSYRPGGPTVPMRLMATPDLDPARYAEVRDLLYRHVYQTFVKNNS